MPIDIYLTVTSPPCRTVLMVAKQLNIDLNEKVLDMRNGEHRTTEFLAVRLFKNCINFRIKIDMFSRFKVFNL